MLHTLMCPLFCRYATLGQYPSWDVLLTEWKEGILFGNGLKRTEPWSVLERDYKEGKQISVDDSWIPWREMTRARKGIMDRKLVIYNLLEAEARGEDLAAFMEPYEEKAHAASEKSKSKSGNTTTVMSQLVKMFTQEWKERGMTPVRFEEDVLKWQLTSKAKKQGGSKQQERTDAADTDVEMAQAN